MRVTAILVCVLIAGGVLAACSTRDGARSDLASVAGLSLVTQRTEEARTVQFRFRGQEREYDEAVDFWGALDFDRQLARIHARIEGMEITMIVDGTTSYVSVPMLTMFLDGNWIRLEEDDEGENLFEVAEFTFFFDPVKLLSALEGAAIDVTDMGAEEVNGEDVRRLRIQFDHMKLWEAMLEAGIEPDPDDESDSDELSSDLFDIWVDRDDRLVRVEGPAAGTATAGDSFAFRIDFTAYGEDPEIEIPDEDDLIDFGNFSNWLDDDTWGLHPFDGAECYDVDIYRCLDTNPALNELAVDPALCQTEEARLCLVPAGLVRRDVVESIVEFHRDAGIDVLVLPSLTVSTLLVDDGMQVTGDDLYRLAEQRYFPGNPYPSTFIVVAPFDVRPEGNPYGWYFGSRWEIRRGDHQHGIFSYFRMANVEPYDGRPLSDELLFERVNKYFGRYTTLLYLGYPLEWDRNYMNYAEMYGFSDLDSMQPNWPDWPAPCLGNEPVICIIPDNDYDDPAFEQDFEAVVSRLANDLDVRVEMRLYRGHFEPSWDPWSEEYRQDLWTVFGDFIEDPLVTVIGVTDDAFREGFEGAGQHQSMLHMERYWPGENLGVVSAFAAGKPGTPEHRERLYRLLLRAIGIQHFGLESSDGPSTVLSDAIGLAPELDNYEPVLPGITD